MKQHYCRVGDQYVLFWSFENLIKSDITYFEKIVILFLWQINSKFWFFKYRKKLSKVGPKYAHIPSLIARTYDEQTSLLKSVFWIQETPILIFPQIFRLPLLIPSQLSLYSRICGKIKGVYSLLWNWILILLIIINGFYYNKNIQ